MNKACDWWVSPGYGLCVNPESCATCGHSPLGHLITERDRLAARIEAVVALCDDPTWGGADSLDMFARDVRSAATGDPK